MSMVSQPATSYEEVELQIKREGLKIDRAARLRAFQESDGYKEFIGTGFLTEEMLRLLGESADFKWPADQRSEFLVQAKAGGVLNAYFTMIASAGERAAKVTIGLMTELEHKRQNGEI